MGGFAAGVLNGRRPRHPGAAAGALTGHPAPRAGPRLPWGNALPCTRPPGRAVRRRSPRPVPETKVRALLAALLAHQGRPVSTARLVAHLWGAAAARPSDGRPPEQGLAAAPRPGHRGARRPETADGDPAGLPAGHRRRRPGRRPLHGTDRPRPDRRQRAAAGRTARRGPGAVARSRLRRTSRDERPGSPGGRSRLEEQRLTAAGGAGRGPAGARRARTRSTAELGDLVARHPLRERLRAVQLTRPATGRAGRARRSPPTTGSATRLADELGVDPGPELAALHRAILRAGPGLRTAAPHRPERHRVHVLRRRRLRRTAPHQPARAAHRTGRPRRTPSRRGRGAARAATGW